MDLGLSGLASGFDWRTLVDQLVDVERAPQRRLLNEQQLLSNRNTAFSSIATQLTALKTRVDALKDPSLFDSRATKVGNAALLSASASANAAIGAYTFNISRLATASVQQGTTNVGAPLSSSNDVSALVLSAASFSSAVTAGTITVNGKQITISTSDTLQDVFDNISAATSGAVTASYDTATDKITLTSASEIVLGSANDTSNFLQAAKLANNTIGTITSSAALGALKLSASLANANFATAVSYGSGTGEFKINGVSINFTSADSISDILTRINNSNAGVTASYDATNDRFCLTNEATGDLGMGLEDVTGNFLAATGLSAGTLTHGQNLIYTINGGPELTSQSNTITDASSNITGLSLTALATGSTTVEVTSDSAKIKAAITSFVADYNKVQALIDTQTASSTNAKGKVTAGILAGSSDANELAGKLRGMVNATVASLSGVRRLASLGIDSNGNDDSLAVSSSKLDAALASNLTEIRDVFAHANDGLAVKLSDYLERAVGEDGSLIALQDNLTRESGGIDTQIADLERVVQSHREQMIASFVAMERAQAKINQQLQFLAQRFGGGQ